MNIIHIAPEVEPFSHHSSVSEATGSLPRMLAELGHNVSVFSPLYSSVDKDKFKIVSTGLKTWVNAGQNVFEYELYTTTFKSVKYIFFRNDDLFNRIGLYGTGAFDYADNDTRFGTFSQAAINYIRYHDIDVDIIHAHDWQTALVPVYKKLHHNEIKCKCVFTIHSIDSQGIFQKFSLEALNLPWDIYNISFIEFYDNISFLKGGIVASDFITSISPTFTQELLDDSNNLGLDGILAQHVHKINGILNGISYTKWNPNDDKFIPYPYSSDNILGKKLCKEEFCKKHGLNPDLPLVAYISKLSTARGVELVIGAIEQMKDADVNFVVLGHSGSNYTGAFQRIKDNASNVKVFIMVSNDVCHNLYAAADILVAPSLYEPCGINQLIGMRYGAIPVVRNIGGLKDGIKQAKDAGCGFSFDEYSHNDLLKTLGEAIELYKSDKHDDTVKQLMKIDNSWINATKQYIKLYKTILEV